MRDDYPWYNSSSAALCRQHRYTERAWCRLQTDESCLQYKITRRAVVSLCLDKVDYYRSRVASCRGGQEKLLALLNNLLGCKALAVMSSGPAGFECASAFANFFDTKI